MNKHPELQSEFKIDGIPLETFIEWISQILANLNEQLCDVLLGIAEKYPQILYYQYMLVRKEITLQSLKLDEIDRKMALLVEPKKFVAHLNLMTFPEHRLKVWKDRFTTKFKNDPDIVKREWKLMLADCFNESSEVGEYNVKFAHERISKLKSKFGINGEKLEIIAEGFSTAHNNAFEEFFKTPIDASSIWTLSKFSNYLADYKPSVNSTSFIEVPTINYKNRTKIVGFDSKVLCLSSIRRPKRLIVHGADEKEYMYLVKGGEDVRQDQRIVQLFNLMNGILKTDPECAKKSLTMRTYEIVPMTESLGLIEWIPNTAPLKEILDDQLNRKFAPKKKDPTKKLSVVSPSAHQQARTNSLWQEKQRQPVPEGPQPYWLYLTLDGGEIKDIFRKMSQELPKNLLVDAISSLTQNLEAYFSLRNKFVRSMSTISICSYIAGIGDRHTENFLFDKTSGEIVSIDYGHAFGSATEQLPVPELVPFRMTGQITNVLPLFSRHGDSLFTISMEYVMKSLQRNKELILTTMEIFVKEPLVDWIKNAHSVKGSANLEDSMDVEDPSTSWYPKMKIDTAKKKLLLANPTVVLIEEINRNQWLLKGSSAVALKNYTRLAKGETGTLREQIGDVCVDVREQVKCLMDLATDPQVLGVSYPGWGAWI
jgi:DNA-dependent protein kinase catalytic subunit